MADVVQSRLPSVAYLITQIHKETLLMPITVSIDQYCSHSSSCGIYDHMETFIDSESNEGCVVFCPAHAIGQVCYGSNKMTPEQWGQIVQLDREMVEVFNEYINRAARILEDDENSLAAMFHKLDC